MKNSVLYILCSFWLVGCSSIIVDSELQKTTTESLILGAVGESKDFILEKDYNHLSLLELDAPIKINLTLQHYSKTDYKAYLKASELQKEKPRIVPDSLISDLKFLKLDIADRVEFIEILNWPPIKTLIIF